MTLHTDPTARAAALQGRRGVRDDWARFVVATLARIVLAAVIGGLFWASVPTLIGWKPTTVMSDSMAPRFFAGDVVVSMPVPQTTDVTGRVVLVDDPDHVGRLRLHRAVDVDAEGALVTRGDANPADDSSHVERASVRGVGILRVPFVGLPILWAKEGNLAGLGALGLGAAVLLAASNLDADLRRGRVAGRARTRRRPQRYGLAIGGAAGVAVLALVASTGAHAAFSAPTRSPSSTWSAANNFACWSNATPPDSPYLYYRGDEAAAARSAVDASGNGHTGALKSGASRAAGICPPSTATASSPAISFDGSSNGQIVPASGGPITGPTRFTIETWFRTTSTTSGKLIGFGDSASGLSGSNDRHLYLGSSGQIVFGVWPYAFKTLTSARGLNDGAWHYAAASLDPSTGTKLYIDGTLVASDSTSTSAELDSGYWRIGYDSLSTWPWTTPGGYGFIGSMDNIAIYTSALSAAQVASHYAAGH